jgi:putative hydrolase of the HAD superfamily
VLVMIKAVFFDWIGTLAHPDPDRHELFARAARELGVSLSPQKLIKGIYLAESQVPAGAPPRWREGKDEAPFIRWWEVLLAEAGVQIPRKVMLDITKRASSQAKSVRWVLYDDALPAMKALKERGLVLGLISNIIVGGAGTGLESYLDLVVTSKEIGADKPEPPIFLAALERAGVNAREAVYVGDQYQTDVLGARGVGIKPILIDRFDLEPEINDCPRIHSLVELPSYL